MPSAQELFSRWLRDRLGPILRDAGFAGSGQNFHRRIDRNWGALNVQRSSWSSASRVSFTLNVGMKSAWVLEDQGLDPELPVREVECDWRTRIGSLLPERLDVWWDIRADESSDHLEALTTVVEAAVTQFANPMLQRMAEDREIVRSTRSGRYPDAPGQLAIRGPILRAIGPPAEYAEAIASIEGRAVEMLGLYEVFHLSTRRVGPKRAAALLAQLASPNAARRSVAAGQLSRASTSLDLIQTLCGATRDVSPYVRGAAAQSLGAHRALAAVDELEALVVHDDAPYAAVGGGIGLAALADLVSPGVRERWRSKLDERRLGAAGIQRGAYVALSDQLAESTVSAR